MRATAWASMLAILAIAACGDNSKECGDGTVDQDGLCVAAGSCGPGTKLDLVTGQCVPDGSVVCTDGTMLDPASGLCVVDPSACQDGTVLVGHQCVDPGKLVADIEEGVEPNGLGLIEASAAQAGNVTLKPVGTPFVIHGKLDPFQDANHDGQLDPDVDTYVLTVTGPKLLHVTADGLHGVAGGFLAVASVDSSDPLAAWSRFGLALSGDTSKREVYLPRAGTYLLAVADTRTLLEYSTGGPVDAAPGGTDGDYYVSIVVDDLPPATTLAVAGGTATATGTIDAETVAFYAVPMGSGLNDVQLAMPSAQANASVVVVNNGAFRAVADEQDTVVGSVPAEAVVGNIAPGDATVVAVDATYNNALAPVAYTLSIATTNATALSTTGQQVTATATAKNGSDFTRLDEFSFDVSASDVSLGLAIHWAQPIIGQVYDDAGNRAAAFSSPFSSAATWTDFTGILRLRRPGRYYFLVFDPAATPGTSTLAVTSTLAALTPDAIVEGTPLTKTLDATFSSNPFVYDAGTTDAWQQFTVSGAGLSGERVAWYAPTAAYGRLDTLTTSAMTSASEVAPLFTGTFPSGGSTLGRILLDDGTTTYYVKVNPILPNGASATLAFGPRANVHDFGTITGGQSAMLTAESLTPTADTRYYLYRTANGNPTTITIHPDAALNSQLQLLQRDESPLGPLINNGATPGVDDSTTLFQTGNGWTAFAVGSFTPVNSARSFDVTIATQAAKSYAVASSATTFVDQCGTGSQAVVFPNDPTGDEDVSLPIAAPAGFLFYGQPVAQLVVSTNGFVSFDTTLTDPAPLNSDLPDASAPKALVAPYWTDLYNVAACTRVVGAKLVVQWTGQLKAGIVQNTNVQMQAILDPADQSIEFVYGAGQEETGDHATIGLQDQAAVGFTRLGFDQHGAIAAPGASRLTPN